MKSQLSIDPNSFVNLAKNFPSFKENFSELQQQHKNNPLSDATNHMPNKDVPRYQVQAEIQNREDQSQKQEQQKDESISKGWLRFFTYVQYGGELEGTRPRGFEMNPQYQDQFKYPELNEGQPDELGTIQIPSEQYFFFVLTKDTLFALTSRINKMAKTYRSIDIKWLEDIKVDDEDPYKTKGGLEDVGNFKEGYCFRIKSKTKVIWNFCADILSEKQKWIQAIKSVAIPQKQTSQYGTFQTVQPDIKFPINLDDGKHDDAKDRDGEWLILQDWSQCTLVCGGGKSYLQRQCKPPKGKGKPCYGTSVVEKLCNEQPCAEPAEETSDTLEPIMKEQIISNRPQRYEICELREEDLEVTFEDIGPDVKYPGRVILNNKTLTVFVGEEFHTVYKSFDLKYISVQQAASDQNKCFQLVDQRDSNKHVSLCILPASLRKTESIVEGRDGWIKDIKMFRDDCQEKSKYEEMSSINNEQTDPDDPFIQRQLHEIEVEREQDKQNILKQKDDEQLEINLQKQIETTARMSLAAVEKEMNYERLAMREEMLREKQEEQESDQELQLEQEKKECIARQIMQKEKQAEFVDATTEAQLQIRQIEENAKKEVQMARSNVYAKILAMKKAAERRRNANKRKIQEIRTDLAGMILNQDKQGDKTLCNPNHDASTRKQYCKEKINESQYNLLADCLGEPMDFCLSCCDNEFGMKYIEKRKDCKIQCADAVVGNIENETGNWAFIPLKNKVASGQQNQGPQIPQPPTIN